MRMRMPCRACGTNTSESDEMMSSQLSRTAAIRQVAKTDVARAKAELTVFLGDVFEIQVSNLRINHDQYSLNS